MTSALWRVRIVAGLLTLVLAAGVVVRVRAVSVPRAQGVLPTLPSDAFFTGYYTSVLAPDEIVTGIVIPRQPAGSGAAFCKFLPATQDDYATVSVAARVALNDDGTVAEARIALGAAAMVRKPVLRARARVNGNASIASTSAMLKTRTSSTVPPATVSRLSGMVLDTSR